MSLRSDLLVIPRQDRYSFLPPFGLQAHCEATRTGGAHECASPASERCDGGLVPSPSRAVRVLGAGRPVVLECCLPPDAVRRRGEEPARGNLGCAAGDPGSAAGGSRAAARPHLGESLPLNKLLAGLALVLAFAAQAQPIDRPQVLVAAPDLQGIYSHTALLVVPMANGQHVGFILNRATDVKLAALFPEHAPSAKVAEPVYFGGPESVESIFAVVRRNPGSAALHLFGEYYVTAAAEAVDRIIEQTPNDARYFAGFVGWERGELASELEAGYWL